MAKSTHRLTPRGDRVLTRLVIVTCAVALLFVGAGLALQLAPVVIYCIAGGLLLLAAVVTVVAESLSPKD